mgnify:CR=1 FL=1
MADENKVGAGQPSGADSDKTQIDPNSPLKPGELSMEGPEGKPIRMRVDLTNGSSVVDMGDNGEIADIFHLVVGCPKGSGKAV